MPNKIKRFAVIFLFSISFAGCNPQILRNPTTGTLATCKMYGMFPLINRANCISDYEDKGWVKTSEQDEAQRQISDRQTRKAKVSEQRGVFEQCVENLKRNPSLQILSGKISLGGVNDQPFSMLTNSNKPTEEEKTAISLFANMQRQCAEKRDKVFTTADAPSAILAVTHSTNTADENLLATLYAGSITYGEYAKRRKEVWDNKEMAFAQIEQELSKNASEADARAQQIAAQNAIAQAQASQAASSSMMAGAAMANAFKPTPRLRTNCTSSAVGSSVQTNCY